MTITSKPWPSGAVDFDDPIRLAIQARADPNI
jgi:hypothetical protein